MIIPASVTMIIALYQKLWWLPVVTYYVFSVFERWHSKEVAGIDLTSFVDRVNRVIFNFDVVNTSSNISRWVPKTPPPEMKGVLPIKPKTENQRRRMRYGGPFGRSGSG